MLVDPLSATQLGGAYRLLQHAWKHAAICGPRLSKDLHTNAGIARLSLDEMSVSWPMVVHALALEDLGTCYRPVTADALWHAAREKRERAIAQRRLAGEASAEKRRQPTDEPSTARQRPVNEPFTGRSPAVPVPEMRAHAGAGAKRSALSRQEAIQSSALSAPRQEATGGERSGQSSGDGFDASALAGAIFCGLEEQARERLKAWRVEQIREQIRLAAERWLLQGRVLDRDGKKHRGPAGIVAAEEAAKLRRAPHVTPADVAIALARIELRDADQQHPDGPINYPLAWLVTAIGARTGKSLEPQLHEQAIVDHWAERERKVFDAAKAEVAAKAAALRLDARFAAKQAALKPPGVQHA